MEPTKKSHHIATNRLHIFSDQNLQQEAHHMVGLGETPRCFVLKRCRYSSLEKFEDAFDTALGLMLQCIILNANKAVRCGIFGRFSNLDKWQPEAAGYGTSSVALDYVGAEVHASVGDHRLNSGLIIQLFVWLDPFCALLCSTVFNNILQPTGSRSWRHFQQV